MDIGLPTGGGSSANALGLSADGKVVVGYASFASGPRAFRWTETGGFQNLGGLGGDRASRAYGVSGDGDTIVGSATDPTSGQSRAFFWTAATGVQGLALRPGGFFSHAAAISSDGGTIVGSASGATGSESAARWTASGGLLNLGTLGGSTSTANAVSANGSVIVGNSNDANQSVRAFRWTEAGGMQSLGDLAGLSTPIAYARGVSGDGNTVVGLAYTPDYDRRAFRWVQASGMQSLGTIDNGRYAEANAISANGQVIVGLSENGRTNRSIAFRHTEAGGMQTIEQWLTANGVTVDAGFVTSRATATNADGSVVVGALNSSSGERSFIARVAPPGLSGAIDLESYMAGVMSTSLTLAMPNQQADLVIHGLHGNPVRGLPSAGQPTAWVSGDIGQQKHGSDNGRAGAGEFGYARSYHQQLSIKLAIGQTYSKQDLALGGSSKVQGIYVMPEAIYRLPGKLLASVSGYLNRGDADIQRGYLNAGTPDISSGSAATQSTGLRLRLDAMDALKWGKAAVSPYISLTQLNTKRKGYTESGGSFAVQWDEAKSRSTQLRVGADGVYALRQGIDLLSRLEGLHNGQGTVTGASGQVIGLNAFSGASLQQRRTSLRAGAGVDAKVGPGTASFMLNATTQGAQPSLWAYAHYAVAF